MAKATCVYITPPTNTSAIDHPMTFPPRDPTRRRFLAVAAVGSIAGAGSLAATTLAPNVRDHSQAQRAGSGVWSDRSPQKSSCRPHGFARAAKPL